MVWCRSMCVCGCSWVMLSASTTYDWWSEHSVVLLVVHKWLVVDLVGKEQENVSHYHREHVPKSK